METEPAAGRTKSSELPDALWAEMARLIPPHKSAVGRPSSPTEQQIAAGIFYHGKVP